MQYHAWVLRQVPRPCARALDVGCGRGQLAFALAERCGEVVGLDCDADVLPASGGHVRFVAGDLFAVDLGRFDCVVSVATLHHLPLRAGLERMAEHVTPGGVLVIVGLNRIATPGEFARALAARVVSFAWGWVRGVETMDAAMAVPQETFAEIAKTVAKVLPGAVVRRRFFFRYTIVWVNRGTQP